MLWKLQERVTAQVTDGCFILCCQLSVFEGAVGIPVTAGKAEGICGDIQCATGYILLPGTDLFLAVPLMKCQKENC